MDRQKSTDVILADFIKGQRWARIFNLIITIAVPLVVLVVLFFGIGTISSQYASAKHEIMTELDDKNVSIENQKKEIEDQKKKIDLLKTDLQITKNSFDMSTVELKALSDMHEAVIKHNRSLRKKLERLGYGYVKEVRLPRLTGKNDKYNSNKTVSQLR